MAGERSVCRVIVLGSTGSIGTQTLEVIEHLNRLHAAGQWGTRYEVVGLAAGRNIELLSKQAMRLGVRQLALGVLESDVVADIRHGSAAPFGEICTRQGDNAVLDLVKEVECDLVVAAMSGAAGLPATFAAVELGRDVALANKETLVA